MIPGLPPLNLSAPSNSTAEGYSSAGMDGSGFVVNFGGAPAQTWGPALLVGAAVVAAIWLMKR